MANTDSKKSSSRTGTRSSSARTPSGRGRSTVPTKIDDGDGIFLILQEFAELLEQRLLVEWEYTIEPFGERPRHKIFKFTFRIK
jgi:hypothetical protein